MNLRSSGLFLTLALVTTALSPAAAKPIPGGARQISALSGKIGQTLWNGSVRLTITELRDATPAEHPELIVPLPSQRVLVMKGIVRNGLPRTFGETLSFTLADKDDVTLELPGHFFTPPTYTIQQGAAVKFAALFPVDKGYQPTKLIVACATCGNGPANTFKPFRIKLTK